MKNSPFPSGAQTKLAVQQWIHMTLQLCANCIQKIAWQTLEETVNSINYSFSGYWLVWEGTFIVWAPISVLKAQIWRQLHNQSKHNAWINISLLKAWRLKAWEQKTQIFCLTKFSMMQRSHDTLENFNYFMHFTNEICQILNNTATDKSEKK